MRWDSPPVANWYEVVSRPLMSRARPPQAAQLGRLLSAPVLATMHPVCMSHTTIFLSAPTWERGGAGGLG